MAGGKIDVDLQDSVVAPCKGWLKGEANGVYFLLLRIVYHEDDRWRLRSVVGCSVRKAGEAGCIGVIEEALAANTLSAMVHSGDLSLWGWPHIILVLTC